MIKLTKNQLLIAGGLIVAVVIAVGVSRYHNSKADEWEQRVQSVLATSAQLVDRAEDAEGRADDAEAAAADLRADAIAMAGVRDVRIENLQEITPPELVNHPAIVERDDIIVGLKDEVTSWIGIVDKQAEALVDLRLANVYLHTAVDSLTLTLEDRPKKRPWYLPRLGIGPYAGVDFDGKPSKGIGVHLAWELKF